MYLCENENAYRRRNSGNLEIEMSEIILRNRKPKRKIGKWIAIILGIIIVLVVAAFCTLDMQKTSNQCRNRSLRPNKWPS